MNHQQVYNNIIESSKAKNRIKLKKSNLNYVYYENHHIIPRCMNGTNDKDNLVLLTAKEHYICHKLLTYIYLNNRKIVLAFHMLINSPNYKKLKVSARDYAYLKELISKNGLSEEAKLKVSIFNKGKITSSETKYKQSIAHLGEKNPMFAKDAWKAINNIKKKCEYCKKETTPGNYGRWHGKNCKHK